MATVNSTAVAAGSPEEDERRKLVALAVSKYNKTLGELTQQEKSDLFRSYQSERATANTFANDPTPQARMFGNVAAAPTWSANLSHAVKSGMGQYQNAKLNQAEKRGRETAAGMAAAESDLAEQRRQEQLKREDERFAQMLGMFGTGR